MPGVPEVGPSLGRALVSRRAASSGPAGPRAALTLLNLKNSTIGDAGAASLAPSQASLALMA